MLKPICVKCQRFYRPKKNGFVFIEGMPGPHEPGERVEPGTAMADRWVPYKLWSGDLYECQGCGHQLVSGTGRNPIAEHYQPDFEEKAQRHGVELQVNDC